MAQYQSKAIEDYFDQFASQEWDRLVKTPIDEIKLEIHAHYLRSYIPEGSRVLEIGAGPGRFTQMLAALGCHVVVTDISQVQIDLNRRYAQDLGFATAVEDWCKADICDLAQFSDGSFDALLCYGGPLSYALDESEKALAECVRVTKKGCPILMSVMSLWGSLHAHLPAVLEVPEENNRLIIETGDLVPETMPGQRHNCHMFRARELSDLLKRQSLEVLVISASNTLATAWNEPLLKIRQSPGRWAELLAMEIEATSEGGCLDTGTHIIAVARKND